jgi:hypothetical protein
MEKFWMSQPPPPPPPKPPKKGLSQRTLILITTSTAIAIVLVLLTYGFWYKPTSYTWTYHWKVLEEWTIGERAIIESNIGYIRQASALPSESIVEEYNHYELFLFVGAADAHHLGEIEEVKYTHSEIFFGTVTYSVFFFSNDGQMWVLNCDKPWNPLK